MFRYLKRRNVAGFEPAIYRGNVTPIKEARTVSVVMLFHNSVFTFRHTLRQKLNGCSRIRYLHDNITGFHGVYAALSVLRHWRCPRLPLPVASYLACHSVYLPPYTQNLSAQLLCGYWTGVFTMTRGNNSATIPN
jgi:hypothetical protein